MLTKRQSLLLAAVAIVAVFAVALTAFGATTYIGGAMTDSGQVVLTSNTGDADAGNDFSAVSFDVPSGTTFAELNELSMDFNVTDDGCMGGSPRFQIRVDTGTTTKNIFAYLGPEPNYNTCDLNTWIDSGDVLSDARTIDTSQLPGGTFYDTYDHAVAAYGSYLVVSVQLVTDAGWAAGDGEQTVRVDNVMINDVTYDFATTTPPDPDPEPSDKDECKNGGWRDFTNPSFKNQGQCVKHMNHNGDD